MSWTKHLSVFHKMSTCSSNMVSIYPVINVSTFVPSVIDLTVQMNLTPHVTLLIVLGSWYELNKNNPAILNWLLIAQIIIIINHYFSLSRVMLKGTCIRCSAVITFCFSLYLCTICAYLCKNTPSVLLSIDASTSQTHHINPMPIAISENNIWV